MPITRRQFELDIDPKTEEWMDRIQKFFDEHKDEAFTEEELRQYYRPTLLEMLSERDKRMLQIIKKPGDPFAEFPEEESAFLHALDKLVETGRIEKRLIRGLAYYACVEDVLPF